MDGAGGRHPTLQSSLIPSAIQTPPNHSKGGSVTEIIHSGQNNIVIFVVVFQRGSVTGNSHVTRLVSLFDGAYDNRREVS